MVFKGPYILLKCLISLARAFFLTIYIQILFRAVPKRTFSRAWGWLMKKRIPIPLRRFVYCTWTVLFGCKVEEMAFPLETYESLSQFFLRPLRDGVRMFSQYGMPCPADSAVVSCGPFSKETLPAVKKLTYNLYKFLGEDAPTSEDTATIPNPLYDKVNSFLRSSEEIDDDEKVTAIESTFLQNHDGSTNLFYIVLYLAPGDYHKFHSPVDFTITSRTHFSGDLYPVNKVFMGKKTGLLAVNERVVMKGSYDQGFMSLTAVGAFNVGSVFLEHEDLQTNKVGQKRKNVDVKVYDEPITYHKGDLMGGFNLGSTVVLVFEAPRDFVFCVEAGEKVSLGQILGLSVTQAVGEVSEEDDDNFISTILE